MIRSAKLVMRKYMYRICIKFSLKTGCFAMDMPNGSTGGENKQCNKNITDSMHYVLF